VVTLGVIRVRCGKLTVASCILAVFLLVLSPMFVVQAQASEYDTYVHTYVDSVTGENVTYLEKPVFPVFLNDSQVAIGENWSIVAPLVANHSYHIYCYGKWVDNGSTPKTNYDIYAYDCTGQLVGYHTPAAGLPAHLGTTVDDPFFVPKLTGNYTFVIRNDPRESQGAQQATFMIIEDAQTDEWHQHYVEGCDSSSVPVLNTSWGYEFATDSQHIEVYVDVPSTLDMYEARLYPMCDPSNPNMSRLNGVPLPWELGLYGNITGHGTVNRSDSLVGGYNLDSTGYRGVAYASCEYYGQSMLINYTSPFVGKMLYHLVLIGEVGYGNLNFLVKTQFGNASLLPVTVPSRVYPNENVTVAYEANSTVLTNATLEYSVDSWASMNTTEMAISNRSCSGVIPGLPAGNVVSYRVDASDALENELTVNGTYAVKYDATINFSEPTINSRLGDNLTISGSFEPRFADVPIGVTVSSGNETKQFACVTDGNGTFEFSFAPDLVGTWVVDASFNGSSSVYACEGPLVTVQVEEPFLAKYQYYIFGAVGAVVAAGMVVYVRKSKA